MSIIEARTAIVEIYQGDYLDRLRHLEQQYEAALEAEKGAPRMMSEVPESMALAEQHKTLTVEAKESALTVTVKALGRKQWKSLVTEHPARPDNPSDVAMGVNEESFKDALVPVSIADPELSAADLDAMADIDFDRLYYSAFALNRSPASPKALPVSPESPESDGTSN